MKNNFIFILLFSFALPLTSEDILYDLTKNNAWILINQDDDKKIYECNNSILDGKYLKIEKKITQDPKLIFNTIKDISKYNLVISNKNIYTRLLQEESDTLYVTQLIKNLIPFVRDREYVFKMFEVSDNRIDWYLLGSKNNYFNNFSTKEVRTLTVGAGSWMIERLDDQIILTNKIFVDDEVNMPDILIQKIRISNIVNIFNDILEYAQDN